MVSVSLPLTVVVGAGGVMLIMLMFIMNVMAVEKKIPSMKAIRIAVKKKKLLSYEHTDSGIGTLKVMDKMENSNQVKNADGVVFFPTSVVEAERLDGYLPIVHYNEGWAYPVNAKGASTAHQIKEKFKGRSIIPTYEMIHILFKKDLKKSPEEIRAELIPDSEHRITDAEIDSVKELKPEIESCEIEYQKPFLFSSIKEFVMLNGMNTNESIMKMKSYAIAVERGAIETKRNFEVDPKTLGSVLIMAAIAFVIYKSAGSGLMGAAGGMMP